MNLVIDIGNTHTKLAWFDKGRLVDMIRLQDNNPDLISQNIDKRLVHKAIISTVRDTNNIPEIFERKGIRFLLLDHTTSLPVNINYNTPETLGRDRIAAVAGAKYVCPYCNVLIFDLGTAITIDFLNSEGAFIGGNISPGLLTRFRALHEFTAKLPLEGKSQEFPEFGTDTKTAIIAGVQQGIIHEINGYITEFSRLYPACEFIITGGDADFFVSKLKKSIFVIPDLVLKGLNYILEYNTAGKKDEAI